MRLNGRAAIRARSWGLTVSLIGLLVLLGWQLDLRWLTSWSPSSPPMVPSTAVAFVLQGLAFAFVARHRHVAAIFAFGELCLACLGLQYPFGHDWGVDQFGIPRGIPAPQPGTDGPWRMSDLTAVGLAMNASVTIAFCFLRERAEWLMEVVSGLLAFYMSWVLFAGYVGGDTRWLRLHEDASQIAVPTALLLLLTWLAQHWAATAIVAEARRREWRMATTTR